MIINPMVTSGVSYPQGFNPMGYMRTQAPISSSSGLPGSGQTTGLNFANAANSQPTMAMPGAGVRPTPGVAPQPNGFVQGNAGGVGALPSRMQRQVELASQPMQGQMARVAALRGRM